MSLSIFYLNFLEEVILLRFPNTFTTVITIFLTKKFSKVILSTVKPVYNDHPWDPKIVAVVDRWSLFRGHLCYKKTNWDLKIAAVIDRWSLFGGCRLTVFAFLLKSLFLHCDQLNLLTVFFADHQKMLKIVQQ